MKQRSFSQFSRTGVGERVGARVGASVACAVGGRVGLRVTGVVVGAGVATAAVSTPRVEKPPPRAVEAVGTGAMADALFVHGCIDDRSGQDRCCCLLAS